MTLPAVRAGRMTSSTSWARAVIYSSISVRRWMAISCRSSRISRSRSPSAVLPGSRQVTTFRPCARRASVRSRICVDLPVPSTPSKLKNIEIQGYSASKLVHGAVPTCVLRRGAEAQRHREDRRGREHVGYCKLQRLFFGCYVEQAQGNQKNVKEQDSI